MGHLVPANLPESLLAAAKSYELGRVSQSKAAEIAGVSRQEFIQALRLLGISVIQETFEEIRSGLGDTRR